MDEETVLLMLREGPRMVLASSYTQGFDPVGHSFGLSSLVAVLPLATLFVLLGVLKVKAYLASLAALLVALVTAVVVYEMGLNQAVLSGSEGAAFGFFPIMWIVINAIWIYNLMPWRYPPRPGSRLLARMHRGEPLISGS